MSDQSNYYVPMTDSAFDEIKKCAIEIWKTYDNTYGYADEKISRINNITNVGDNGMYIIAMFDGDNVIKLLGMVSDSTKEQLMDKRLPNIFIF